MRRSWKRSSAPAAEPVDERVAGALGREGDGHDRGRVGARLRERRRRADVHVHGGVGRLARVPQRIPVLGEHARQTERGRALAEAHRVAALRRAPFDLDCRQIGVPQRDQRERDQAAAAPSPPHHSSIIQSLYACTQASASSLSWASRKVWPQNRGNVGKQSDASTWFASMSATRATGLRAPGEHVVEEHGRVAHVVTVEAHRHERRRDRHGDVLVQPPVAPLPVVGFVEREVTPVVHGPSLDPLDARAPVAVPRREVASQTSGGSTTWSSTEIMRGSSIARLLLGTR